MSLITGLLKFNFSGFCYAILLTLLSVDSRAQTDTYLKEVTLGLGANQLFTIKSVHTNGNVSLKNNFFCLLGYNFNPKSSITSSVSNFIVYYEIGSKTPDFTPEVRYLQFYSLTYNYNIYNAKYISIKPSGGIAYRKGFERYYFDSSIPGRREFYPKYNNIAMNVGIGCECKINRVVGIYCETSYFHNYLKPGNFNWYAYGINARDFKLNINNIRFSLAVTFKLQLAAKLKS